MTRRRIAIVLAAIGALALLTALGLRNARAEPLVRTATIALPGWPAGAPPLRIVLAADIHIGTVAMDAARLDRIVAGIDRLRPDLVLLAGDFVAGHDPGRAADSGRALTTSLAGLRPRLGTVAVLGNHDHWTDAATITAALARAGIAVLRNRVQVRGPLAIGGVDDDFSGHANTEDVLRRLDTIAAPRLILSHSPDVSPQVGNRAALVLAGHTHCGQIVLPLLGAPSVSRYGARYRCGLVREGGRITIVTAGLGASEYAPLRFRAPPDLWLLTVGAGS